MLSLVFWAIGLPFWILIGAFAGLVEIVPVIGPLAAGALAVGVGLTESMGVAAAAGIVVLVVRLLEDYIVIPRVLGHAVGLSPLLVLFSVAAVALLFGEFAVLLAIPLAAVVATLFDVIVLDKNPAEEDVPTVIFPAKDVETTSMTLGPAPAAEDEAAEREAEPEAAEREAPIATALRPGDSRCQRPSASFSSTVSGSPRRCLRSAPPARSPR